MICVLSQPGLEGTTEEVVSWLRGHGVPFVRLNGDDIMRPESILSLGARGVRCRIQVGEKTVDTSDISVVWLRRWAGAGEGKTIICSDESQQDHGTTVTAMMHLRKEIEAVSGFLFGSLRAATWLTEHSEADVNKLHVLSAAAEIGLRIPETLVTANPEQVRAFIRRYRNVITKPLSDPAHFRLGGERLGTYTTVVTESDLDEMDWSGGFPSLFQERIGKRYEIRTFYLDGECSSMAIFSQRRAETQVDFRRYQFEDPDRTVPYRLPEQIENKLIALMKKLPMSTGSVDLIRSEDGEYVFLEVNPVGQFAMVSGPCNYFLERRMAQALADRYHARHKHSEASRSPLYHG